MKLPRSAQSSSLPPFFPSNSRLPTDLSFDFLCSELRGVTLSKNLSKKSEILVLSFQSLTTSPFTFFHSCRNKSFICTVFTKVPRGTPLPLPTPKVLLELCRHDFQFPSHYSLFFPNLALARTVLRPNHRPAATARTKELPGPPQPLRFPPPPSTGARSGMNSTTQPISMSPGRALSPKPPSAPSSPRSSGKNSRTTSLTPLTSTRPTASAPPSPS